MFERPVLKELDQVRATDLAITMFDQRSGQSIEINDGVFVLQNGEKVLTADLDFGLAMQGDDPAQLHFSAEKGKGVTGARLVAEFSDLSARDLAGQVGALSFLKILDAPTGGQLTASIDGDGNVSSLGGVLNISKGALRPGGQAVPYQIDGASAELRYSVATGRLFIDDISVSAPEAELAGSGHLDLRDLEAMVPQTILAQLRLRDMALTLDEMFERPVAFQRGAIDLRYRPATQSVEIGQFVLQDGGTEIVARGNVGVDDNGWKAAIDAQIRDIDAQGLLALWPKGAAVKTRDWLRKNILAGELSDATAALRLAQGKKPRQAVTFNFDQARVRYMKTLPPIENGVGYGAMTGNQFILNLHSGHVVAPDGNELDVSGSTLEIADVAAKPAALEVDLNVSGDLQGTLALLDEKPFEFLNKSGLDSKIATGQADVVASLRVPLIPKLTFDKIGFDVKGTMLNVRSDVLAKDHLIEARSLSLAAGNGRLSIGGPGRFDGVPMDATWSRAIGKGADSTSVVEGWIELSPNSLDAFKISLPKGMVSGAGRAEVDIVLAKDVPPELKITSDLNGVGLKIAALGWSKPRNASGNLSVGVTLGAVPRIKDLRIETAGLSTSGSITLNDSGGFSRADFQPLRIAGRFNSDVSITARGRGRPVQIAVNGGRLDVRQFGVSGGGSGGAGPPIKLALDRLIISDSIALHGFSADFQNTRGLEGGFRASVNGQALVSGTLTPTARGPAIDIASSNGGAVMRGSGIFKNAQGGDMSLRLIPTGQAGEFDGKLQIDNTRVVNAPALAELLSALSVVGILEQLGQSGIPFSQVQADFVLGKSGVTVKSSSAVGASMGISMEGIYDTNTARMNLQGVVSPIYAVNGLFGAMFSPRRGEGLFGFNYTLKGSADDPQVGVNPLSMLTPGIFREIFRQPPPKL
jgi:hypothetical protein